MTSYEYNASIEQQCYEVYKQYFSFKEQFFEYLGIVNNPRREKFFAKCWELEHKRGNSSVLSLGKTLVSIIQ